MKKYAKYFKNKFIFISFLFLVHTLFLDDMDIFSIIGQNQKLNRLRKSKVEVEIELKKAQNTVKKLRYPSALETFAREKKLFKRDNEDIFVVSYE